MVQHRALVVVLSCLVAACLAAPAHGATVARSTLDGGVFVGGDATINYLFITTPDPAKIRVRAAVGTITTTDPACSVVEADTIVECNVTALLAEVAAGDEADIIDVEGAIAARVYGGAGDDALRGGSVADFLSGDEGNAQLFGRDGDDDQRGEDGNDRLDGGEGSDLAIGGLGADTLEDTGGTGTDSVTYKVDSVASGVSLSVGDGGNDGRDAGAEGDNVREGFERLQGSNFNDVIRGGPAAETINGSLGDDDIDGGLGADTIEGNGGNDILRARDGVADTRLDCDAASDPVETNGTADAAFIDGAGLDPAPSRCEAVDAGTATAPADTAPANTFPPVIRGRATTGERLVCDPGAWSGGGAFSYAWTLIAADGARTAVASTIDYTVPFPAGGYRAECAVTATNAKGSSVVTAALVTIAKSAFAPSYKKITRRMPDFTAPTTVCGKRKGFCEAEQVRSRILGWKLHLRYKGVEVEGLRAVPAALRSFVRPGTVIATKPKPGAKLVSGPEHPVTIKVTYYVPNADRDCPVEENVNVRGGADYTLADLVAGLSLRDAVATLREHGCRAADYDVDYRYAKGVVDAKVSAARKITKEGRDQLRLTVLHSAPDLQLGIQPITPGKTRLPMALAASGGEVHFVSDKEQATDFAVSVATKAGIGFKNARVELRSPSGHMVDSAITGAGGVATFTKSKIAKDGTYELWASVTDAESDALVGWKPIRAITVKDDFVGFTGRTYDYAKGVYTLRAVARHAPRAQAAAAGTLGDMRAEAQRACDSVLPLLGPVGSSAALSRTNGALTVTESTSLKITTQNVCTFADGRATLDQLISRGVRPTLATLGGSLTLAVERVAAISRGAVAYRGNRFLKVAEGAIAVGRGALGFVSTTGVTIYPGGSFSLQAGGGSGFGAKGATGRIVVDAALSSLAIEQIGAMTLVAVVPGGAGNLISDKGAGLIGQDGAGLIGQDGAGILSDNGLGILANDGAAIVAGGAGNIISDNGGGIVSNDGATIVAGGAGNIIAAGGA